MYESHFGLTGSPFRLVPDPSFYFDSRTHANALAYLKFGVFQAEGFIVVTGEVGAGKTTLVRTLLGELSEDEVVAAHVVTTRLDPEDLLRSTLVAFGIPPTGPSKAHLLSTLEGFLTAVAANGKRALLVVDEAQNLTHEAIEELRMLSNFQIGNRPLLQSFLVGQPELRKLVQDPRLEQFRQRIIASCHLGPLAPSETRAYVEHRLKQSGWSGRPHFTDDSFERIHRRTGGIPRRINLLCSRLLLSAYLQKSEEIGREDVDQTASDLASELGGVEAGQPDPQPPAPQPAPRRGGRGRPAPARAEATSAAARPEPSALLPEVTGGLLCLVDSDWSYALAGLVCKALAKHRDGPVPVVVHLRERPGFVLASLLGGEAHELPPEVFLHLPEDSAARRVAQLGSSFLELLGRLQPRALLTSGASDELLTCVMSARREGVPSLRLEAGTWGLDGSCQDSAIAAMIDRVATARYASSTQALRALRSEGLPEDGTVCPGSLTAALLQVVSREGEARAERHGGGVCRVLVSVQPAELGWHSAVGDEWCESLRQLGQRAGLLSHIGQRCEVVWLLKQAGWDRLHRARDDERLAEAGVQLVKANDYLDELRWLAQSDCLVASARSPLREEAVAMQLPIAHVLSAEPAPVAAAAGTRAVAPGGLSAYVVSMLGNRQRVPVLVEEDAAGRIAEHLRGMLSIGMPLIAS
jgi:putative secretion ATPase (PEP-CTERM system associated)